MVANEHVRAPMSYMYLLSQIDDSRLYSVVFFFFTSFAFLSLSFPLIANANAVNKSQFFFCSPHRVFHIVRSHIEHRIAHLMLNGARVTTSCGKHDDHRVHADDSSSVILYLFFFSVYQMNKHKTDHDSFFSCSSNFFLPLKTTCTHEISRQLIFAMR